MDYQEEGSVQNTYANGVQALESFFEPMAATLSAFADERNLLIEKYRHEGFVWSLKFRHPRGGEAVVQVYRKEVERKDSETVVVRGDWWVDDYPAGTRSIRRGRSRQLERCQTQLLISALEDSLDQFLAWVPGLWDQVIYGLGGDWARYWRSKDEFDRLLLRLPEPR